MSGEPKDPRERSAEWVRTAFDAAVQMFIDRGVMDSSLLEAKPVWGHPPDALIVIVREQRVTHSFYWVICGDGLPFDYLHSTAARHPRDAARHFAMKWHLEAARLQQSASVDGASAEAVERQARGDTLVAQAEALFRLVNEDSLWG